MIFSSLRYQLRIIAKESLARFPVLGWHLKRGKHLFVDRQNPDRAGIFKRWRALVSEASLMVYAEGTRSRDGHVAKFKAGSFLLAIEAQLPVVPVAVIGTRAVMPKGRLRTEPADIRLIIHEPIQPPALAAPTIHDARQLAERVHAIVSDTVETLQNAVTSVRGKRRSDVAVLNPASPRRDVRDFRSASLALAAKTRNTKDELEESFGASSFRGSYDDDPAS